MAPKVVSGIAGSYFTSSKDGFPGISAAWPPSDQFHGDRRPSVPRDRRCGGSSTLVWSATERWDDGTGRLLIERSKTDQTGEGEVVFITRRAMTALDELRQIREHYGDASPSVFVMTAKTINRRVKAAAQAAGLGEGFSGHSAWGGWPGGWTGPAPGLGDHAAGPMAQHRRGGEVHPGRVRPVAEMRDMSQRSFGGVAVPTVRVEPRPTWKGAPAALGLGPALLGTGWAAEDVAARTEDTGPRLLCAPRRLHLGSRPGEPVPHGQNRRPPKPKPRWNVHFTGVSVGAGNHLLFVGG